MNRIAVTTVACVALAFLAVAGAALAVSRTATTSFRGTTAQHFGITLQVTGATMGVHYSASYRCNGVRGKTRPQTTDFGGVLLHGGHWAGTETISLAPATRKHKARLDTIHFQGQISRRRANGSFNEIYTSANFHTCKSGEVTFTAHR